MIIAQARALAREQPAERHRHGAQDPEGAALRLHVRERADGAHVERQREREAGDPPQVGGRPAPARGAEDLHADEDPGQRDQRQQLRSVAHDEAKILGRRGRQPRARRRHLRRLRPDGARLLPARHAGAARERRSPAAAWHRPTPPAPAGRTTAARPARRARAPPAARLTSVAGDSDRIAPRGATPVASAPGRPHHVGAEHPDRRQRQRGHQPQARPHHAGDAAPIRSGPPRAEPHRRATRSPICTQHRDAIAIGQATGPRRQTAAAEISTGSRNRPADRIGDGVGQTARRDQRRQRHGPREQEFVLGRSGADGLAAGGPRRQAAERERAGDQRQRRELPRQVDRRRDRPRTPARTARRTRAAIAHADHGREQRRPPPRRARGTRCAPNAGDSG